jgi:hypothetical protein
MPRLVALMASLVLLVAACGGNPASDETTTTAAAVASSAAVTTTSTIPADDDGDPVDGSDIDYPPAPEGWTSQCVAELVTYLELVEPAASAIDWDTATVDDVNAIEDQFAAQSDAYEAQIVNLGCGDPLLLSNAEGTAFMKLLVAEHIPGLVDFIDFLTEAGG